MEQDEEQVHASVGNFSSMTYGAELKFPVAVPGQPTNPEGPRPYDCWQVSHATKKQQSKSDDGYEDGGREKGFRPYNDFGHVLDL